MTVTFRVLGKPQPAGSKKGFVNPKTSKVVIVTCRSCGWGAFTGNGESFHHACPDPLFSVVWEESA
jgi:hypothetical protein